MLIKNVLVIDDEPANCDFAVRLFQTQGLTVFGAGNAAQALQCAGEHPEIELAMIDHQLPDSTGLELLKKFRVIFPNAILVMATMHDHRALIDEAFDCGADIFLVKPHGFMELYKRIPQAIGDESCLRGWIIDSYGPRQRKNRTAVHTSAATQTAPVVPIAAPPSSASQPTSSPQPGTIIPPVALVPAMMVNRQMNAAKDAG